jgi:hypothetical protein
MLTYTIQLQANGIIKWQATIPAHVAGLVGDYHQGIPYAPSPREVLERLPYRYRKAFNRAIGWWRTGHSSRPLPLKCDLKGFNGKDLGTLFATPNF